MAQRGLGVAGIDGFERLHQPGPGQAGMNLGS
jgi:hypothetical protein